MSTDISAGKVRRRILQIFVFVALPIGAIAYFFLHDPMPEVPRPAVEALPNPNALQTYLRAEKAIIKRDYFPAFDHDSNKRSAAELRKRLDFAMKSNSETYKLVGLGLTQSYGYPIDPDNYITTDWKNLMAIKDVAKFLQSRSQNLANYGDFDGAIRTLADGLRLSSQVKSSGVILNRLVGNALGGIARGRAWPYIDLVHVPAARESAHRIMEIEIQTRPFHEVAQYGFECDRYCLATLLKERDWKSSWQKLSYMSEMTNFETTFRNAIDSRRNALESFEFWMQESMQRMSKKFSDRGSAVPVPLSPVAALFALESFDEAWNSDLRDSALNILFATMLALRACHIETKTYPSVLEQLVPRYLPKVPMDPYEPGKPFQYKLIGSNYLLYSVGPDGKDDGGTPIPRRSKSYTFVGTDSLGDIVAGFTK